VYQPDSARVAAVEAELAEANNPLNVHYDATREVRAKGAGFYQFSGDAETRARQLEELKAARDDTALARQQAGAMDVQPGEVEGLKATEDAGAQKSRAMEKRKREIEERRKLLDSKRRKVLPPPMDDSQVQPQAASNLLVPTSSDPFAALEALANDATKNFKGHASQADDFLAQLEREIQHAR
jgi:N-acetylmuramoyl-L-alanine amidase